MHRQTLKVLGDALDSHDAMSHERRAALILADNANDPAARQVASERAARCERRLVQLRRLAS